MPQCIQHNAGFIVVASVYTLKIRQLPNLSVKGQSHDVHEAILFYFIFILFYIRPEFHTAT